MRPRPNWGDGSVSLVVAAGADLEWCRRAVVESHYLGTAPDPRSRPFAYVVRLADMRIGCLFFGRPESTKCFRGGLTFGSAEDVAEGRAQFDRWEVLNLSRVWLSPDVQPGGRFFGPRLPGFVDRHGTFRSTLGSTVILRSLESIGRDYLMARPPCFIDEPYSIRIILSYCDRSLHRGTLYRSSGFELARTNDRDIETWFTSNVTPLTHSEDSEVRRASAACPRAAKLRAGKAIPKTPLFGGIGS